MNSGRWVILTIFALAGLASAFAWWFRGQQGNQALQFWGSQTAYMIRFAPDVTAWRLRSDASAGWSKSSIDGQDWFVQETCISQARGLRHARQAFIEDASYRWESTVDEAGRWNFALKFAAHSTSSNTAEPLAAERQNDVTLLIDTEQQIVRRLEGGPAVRITIGQGLKAFLSEQFSAIEKTGISSASAFQGLNSLLGRLLWLNLVLNKGHCHPAEHAKQMYPIGDLYVLADHAIKHTGEPQCQQKHH